MSSRVPACESVVNSIWRRMQQAWTVTAFRESRGAPRRFRSAERGNATSSGLLIERVGSLAPARLSVKARAVKSTLPALRSREGTRAPAPLRSGLRHRSAVARERLVLAQRGRPARVNRSPTAGRANRLKTRDLSEAAWPLCGESSVCFDGCLWPTPDGSCFHFGTQPSVTQEHLPSPTVRLISTKWFF